jgi:hypothetical protein
MNTCNADAQQMRLNVGGVVFYTTVETLMREPHSYFTGIQESVSLCVCMYVCV